MKNGQIFILLFILTSNLACKNIDCCEPPPVNAGDISSAELIQIFPASHPLKKDITNDPIDPTSDAI